jgi:hypothetical protein
VVNLADLLRRGSRAPRESFYLEALRVPLSPLVQVRSNLASNPRQTDAPLNVTRSLSSRFSPDWLRLAEPVRKR